MKNLFISAVAAVSLLCGTLAMAEDKPAAAGTQGKIAIIDIQSLMQEAPQVAKMRDELKKKYEPKEKELIAESEKVRVQIENFRRDSSVMNEKDRATTEKDITSKQQALQTKQGQLREEIMKAQTAALQGFMTEIEGILKTLSEKNNYDVVINKAALAYSKNSLDITKEVVTLLAAKKK